MSSHIFTNIIMSILIINLCFIIMYILDNIYLFLYINNVYIICIVILIINLTYYIYIYI